MTDRIAVFAKAPVAGQVKTRLAAEIGDAAALQAHRDLVVHALTQLAGDSGYLLELWCSQPHAEAVAWADAFQIPLFIQQGENLGDRMAHCLQQLCAGGGRGVIVGCDCPDVDAAYAHAAFAALAQTDLVLGPAADGGYGLIGARAPVPPDLFADMIWSTDRVLKETLQRARAADISVTLLSEIWDVDRPEDWRRFRHRYC